MAERIHCGELFTRVETAQGKIEALAEVYLQGTTLHLKDVCVYPMHGYKLQNDVGLLLGYLRGDPTANPQNLEIEKVHITGVRYSNARIGKPVDRWVKTTGIPKVIMLDNKFLLRLTAVNMLQQGEDMEAVLLTLRQGGYSIIDSIKAVRTFKGISTNEAKEIVHFSKTWADMRKQNDQLHADAEAALEQFVLSGTEGE